MLTLMAVITTLLGSVQSAPAPSPQAEPAAAPSAAADTDTENDGDRVICRRERVLGSNRPQRICMTQTEWQYARDASRETRDRSLREVPFDQGEGGGPVNRSF